MRNKLIEKLDFGETSLVQEKMFQNRIEFQFPFFEDLSDSRTNKSALHNYRSVISHRIDDRSSLRDRRGSSSINGSTTASVTGSRSALIDKSATRKDGRRISNSVQAQIERMFTDVAKDTTTCSFPVRCLGSMPLKDKVTSLSGLQDPLRQLYLSGAGHGVSCLIL